MKGARSLTMLAAATLTLTVLAACSGRGSDVCGDAVAVDDGLAVIEAEMTEMAFAPASIDVTAGETVRLRFHNAGLAVHEAVIGDLAVQEEHAEEMVGAAVDHEDSDESEPVIVAVGETSDLFTPPALRHPHHRISRPAIGCRRRQPQFPIRLTTLQRRCGDAGLRHSNALSATFVARRLSNPGARRGWGRSVVPFGNRPVPGAHRTHTSIRCWNRSAAMSSVGSPVLPCCRRAASVSLMTCSSPCANAVRASSVGSGVC